MECQFCSQPIQVLKLMPTSSTMTYHNVTRKITDGKCSKGIITTHSFPEESTEIKSERPFQLIFKINWSMLLIKTTLWSLVKELKLVFSKALWWSLQIFNQYIHLEMNLQLKSNSFTLNLLSMDNQSKAQLSCSTLKHSTQEVPFSKLVKHMMLMSSWKSFLLLVPEKT